MSQNQKANEMGTKNVGLLLLEYSIPAILGMIVVALNQIISSIFIGHGVGPMALAAAAAGADGLMIEVHNDPQHAWCDGPQSITPAAFASLAEDVRHILPYCQYNYEQM